MKREARLQSAKQWIPQYEGKSIVRGYAKHFGVDFLCAIAELETLGVKLDPNYVAQLKCTVENRRLEKQRRKKEKQEEQLQTIDEDSDDTFAFIAGYTSGGAPYGITWEEWEEQGMDCDDVKNSEEPV